MEIKKNPKASLDNFSKIFFQIGLVFTLLIIHLLLEHKTYEKNYEDLGQVIMQEEMIEDIPIIKMQKIKPTQTSAPPPPTVEKVEIVENDVEITETIIESTETNQDEAITDAVITTGDIVEVEEVEEVVEDVPFMLIENVPVFPGCKGNNKQLKKCFSKETQRHFTNRFNPNLASSLGLSEGIKKLYVVFRINNKGVVENINVRAPHPLLKKEVIKIMSKLPQMKPGRQRGLPVSVSYSIPISFKVVL